MLEEYQTNSDGLVISEGTWDYKIPTLDTIPKQFNVEILNSGHHQNRVLSSKGTTPNLYVKISRMIHAGRGRSIWFLTITSSTFALT